MSTTDRQPPEFVMYPIPPNETMRQMAELIENLNREINRSMGIPTSYITDGRRRGSYGR